MSVVARYSGICPECGEQWQPGDLIRQGDEGLRWHHAACPDEQPDVTLPPGVTASCPTCFLIHPKGGCDRE